MNREGGRLYEGIVKRELGGMYVVINDSGHKSVEEMEKCRF